MIENELSIGDKDYKDEITKAIINRIGYSIADFNVYKQDLLALLCFNWKYDKKGHNGKETQTYSRNTRGLLTRKQSNVKRTL